MRMLKIAWGITGCGDRIEETFGIMNDLSERYDRDIKVYLSKKRRTCDEVVQPVARSERAILEVGCRARRKPAVYCRAAPDGQV